MTKLTIHTIESVKSIESIFHQAWTHVCNGQFTHMVYHYGEWVDDSLREILQGNESSAQAAWQAVLKARDETKLVNCTPHEINIINDNGEVVKNIPISGIVPRLTQTSKIVGELEGVKISETVFGETTNLPEEQEGIFLIVSRLVLAANLDRNDLLAPNEMVRDDKGQIIGCKSLARN